MMPGVPIYKRHEDAAVALASETILTYRQAYRIVALLGRQLSADDFERLVQLIQIISAGTDIEGQLTALIGTGWIPVCKGDIEG